MDEEYREVVREFYALYRPLQKRYGLRMHSHFDIYSAGTIKIWEYHGEKRGSCICSAKEEADIDCYRRAIQELISYRKKKEEENKSKERMAG